VKITIDGRSCETTGALTILEAARRLGISIPTLCEHRRLVPYAACRICLVEIAGRKLPAPACATPVEDGMEIVTNSPKIRALRREVLDLILSEHPSACLVCLEKDHCEEAKSTSRKSGEPTGCILCPADGQCELQKVAADVGLTRLSHPMAFRGSGVRRDDPFIDRDDGLCILCGRCVRICHEIRGAAAIAFVNRGSRVAVGTSMDKRLLDVGCRFCGACVDVCPTGALTGRSVRYGSKYDETRSFICGLCGQGCRLGLRLRGGLPVEVRPDDGPPNEGQACVKGRFIIGDLIGHSERLTRPMVRKAGVLVESSWEEALAAAGRGLAGLKGEIEVVLSSQDSCEDLWALGKLSRDVLGASVLRLAEESSVYSLGRPFGSQEADILAPPVTVDDLGKARLIFIFEEALPLTAPIFGVAVNQAVLKGAKLVAAGDGEYCLDRCASVKVKSGPAEAGRFLLALLGILIENNNHHFANGAAGFEKLRKAVRERTPETRADAAAWKLDRIVGLIEKRRPAAFVFGPRFVAGPWGARNAAAVWNLAGLTGGLYVPVGWEANARGAVEIMAKMKASRPSSSATRAVVLAGPDPAFLRKGEELVVVFDAFRSAAVAQADVVFPRTVFVEQDGTFVNAEGRLQFSAAVVPPGNARPLRTIASDLARAMAAAIPALKTREAVWEDLTAAVPSLAEAIRAAREKRAALIGADGFDKKGMIEIPDRDAVFDPAAAFALRDPDDYLGFPAALELKSLRTVRRR
jgi:predicted molibdopterin-dependent oxidoreductase YjgC